MLLLQAVSVNSYSFREVRSTGFKPRVEIKTMDWTLISILNVGLFSIFAVLLFFYVFWINSATSTDFRISSLSEKITALNEMQSTLIAESLSFDNPADTLSFARQNNMVEAGEVKYLFSRNNGVALDK